MQQFKILLQLVVFGTCIIALIALFCNLKIKAIVTGIDGRIRTEKKNQKIHRRNVALTGRFSYCFPS
jgi:hypothetical protein